jgi:uncharacterized protein YggE
MAARSVRPIVAPLAFATLALAALGPAHAAEEVQPRTVTTTGSATVYVTPNRVDIRFTVHAFDADLAKAKAQNDEVAKRTLALLKDNGIEEKSIGTEFASTEPVYGERRHNDGRIERGPIQGYNVSRSYSVRLDDVSKFGGIVDRLLTDPNVTLGGHSFSSKEDRRYRDQARRDAAVAAREKAQLLAETLGMQLGAPRTVADVTSDGGFPPRPMFANSLREGGPGADGGDTAPIGQIEVRAVVNVSFDLVPRQ